jgi:YHS domain-containing protein
VQFAWCRALGAAPSKNFDAYCNLSLAGGEITSARINHHPGDIAMIRTANAILLRAAIAAVLLLGGAATSLPANAAPVWTGLLGTAAAVGGHDAVSYFGGKPVDGSGSFTRQHKGATSKFASAANLAAFTANPDKYAPQYGGHCAWAAADNYRFASDPKVWRIVDGKLYLNYNRDVQVRWEKDTSALIAKANTKWVSLGKQAIADVALRVVHPPRMNASRCAGHHRSTARATSGGGARPAPSGATTFAGCRAGFRWSCSRHAVPRRRR